VSDSGRPVLRWVEAGDYRTMDGCDRIVKVDRDEWQLQEWIPGGRSGWWSWVSTRPTKRECVNDLVEYRTRSAP